MKVRITTWIFALSLAATSLSVMVSGAPGQAAAEYRPHPVDYEHWPQQAVRAARGIATNHRASAWISPKGTGRPI